MRKNPIFLVLLAILVAQPLLVGNLGVVSPGVNDGVFTPALGTRLAPGDHTNHVPILIDGNDDFVSQGWPGSGTSGDPYVISGLNITYANGMMSIRIEDTTAYFVIRDCYIDQGSPTRGIYLLNASHGTIEHCTVNAPTEGIYLYQSNSTTISHTEAYSIGNTLVVEYSWNCLVANSAFDSENSRSSYWYESPNPTLNYNYWNADPGDDYVLEMHTCNNTVITHSTITDGFRGLVIYTSYDIQITNLTVIDVTNGMQFYTCGEIDISDSYSESPETTLYMNACNDSSVINSEFICDDDGDYAIGIYDSHRFTFTGNYLADAEAYGLVVNNCEESVINSNTVFECEPVGILLDDCPDSEVIGNTVHGSGGSGIEMHDSPRCTIDNNDIFFAETGIYGNNPDNSTFIGNTLEYHLGGIYLENSPEYVNISGNLIDDAEYGIYVVEGEWCRIHDNEISNVDYGLYFQIGEDLDVYNNNIMSAADTGIYFQDHDDMHIHQNTITNADNGITESSGCERARVEDNTIDSVELGITVQGINCSIVNNDITNAEVMGIWQGSTENCEIRGNTISGAPQFGISSYMSINTSLIDNVFTDCGFILENIAGMVYYNHTISGNTVNGQPIYYGVSEEGGSVDLATYGQVILLNCSYMDIIGATVGQVSAPVQIFYSFNITVSDIISSPNIRTITSYETDNVTITDITSVGRENDWEFSSAGIYLRYCDNFQIENFDHSEGYYGIYMYSASYGSIESYTADNAYRGISAGSGTNSFITVNDAEITNMGYHGIYGSGNNWTVTNCYIYNVSYGIYATSGLYWYIENNVIEHSWRGISVNGGATDSGVIHLNEIYSNEDYGIIINNGDNWDILNNTVLWNYDYGIYLSGSSGTEVHYNVIGLSGNANGYDTVAQNWDDGVDTGNWWSDYSGTGTYSVNSATDNYPMQFLPTNPIINDPLDLYYAEGDTGNDLTWLVYDDYLSHYSVSIDGSVWAATACPDLTLSEIIIEVDGLAYGDHPVIITVWDIEDNTVTHSLTIHVFDDIDPTISSEPNMEAFVGGSSQVITWEVFDLHPGEYTVLLDDVESTTGTWTSGALSADIDGLTAGYHSVLMTIYDADGNSAYDAVEILVIGDSTNPVIDSPADLSIIYGSTGNRIIWTPADDYPSGYEVSANNSVLLTDDWGGSRIILDIDSLEVGEYTFTLTVWDGTGNEVSDAVDVVVLPYEGWTPEPTPADYTMVIIAVGAVAGVIVIIVVVYFLKFKKS